MSAAPARKTRLTSLRLGKIFVTIAALAAVALFQKADLAALLRNGKEFDITFAEAHRLRPSVSKVKIAGVAIGVVRSVERTDDGSTIVRVKVDRDVLETMGTAPSARIRPATLLGGNYYVEIVPGGVRGRFSGTIPVSRTSLPVELDGVAAAFPANARQGVRTSIGALDDTLGPRGSTALRRLVRSAPGPLGPLTQTLDGLQGTGRNDLAHLVDGVEGSSRVLSARQNQLGRMVDDLAATSRVLDVRRTDLATTAATMPGTLDETNRMLGRLDDVLVSLQKTAGPAKPSVRALDRMLKRADPVLAEARPVVHDLRGVLTDARPLVQDLVPTAADLRASVGNVRGPVLTRVNGPILGTLMSPWHGTGRYAGGGADRPMFKEVGYMFSNLAAANMMDRNGSMISFLPGGGAGSVSGLPFSLETFFSRLTLPQGGTR